MNSEQQLTLEAIAIHITRLNIALEAFPNEPTEDQVKAKEQSTQEVDYWLAVLRRAKGLIK